MASNNSITSTVLDPLGRNKVQIGFEVFFAVIICIVSTSGNVLVVFVINKDSQLKNITNMFIHNLAWTDICMATLIMPFWIINLYNGHWVFSTKLCEWVAAMTFTCVNTSIWTMVVIAVNRYLKVVKPNVYPKLFPSKRMARVYCVSVWLLAVLFSTPPLYGWGQYAYNERTATCTLVWEIKNISFGIVFWMIDFCVIFGVIVFCYYKIYRTVKASSTNLSFHAAQNNVPNITINNMSQTTDIKLLKATFTVVCIFAVCWAPVALVSWYQTIFGNSPRLVATVVIFLIFCSSGVNPIIYGVMNPQLKRAFVKVISCKSEGENHTNQIVVARASRRTSATQRQPAAVLPNDAWLRAFYGVTKS